MTSGTTQTNLTPIAIVVGAIIISLGLYFGLHRDAAPPASAPSASAGSAPIVPVSSASAAAVASTTAPRPDASTPPSPSATADASARSKATIDSDVAQAIEKLKQRTVKECWLPLKGQPGLPAKVKFVYSGSFDPTGKEVARGISEDREANAPKVSACLRSFSMELTIPAPGQYVNVNVPFEVP